MRWMMKFKQHLSKSIYKGWFKIIFLVKNKTMTSYNINSFISPCCDAFNVFQNDIIICSKCKQVVKQLTDDEELTIAIQQ